MKKLLKLGMSATLTLSINITYSQTLKLKTITDMDNSYKVDQSSCVLLGETQSFWLYKYFGIVKVLNNVSPYTDYLKINKNQLGLSVITFKHSSAKSILKEKLGAKYLGDITYTQYLPFKDDYLIVSSFVDKNESGEHVTSASIFIMDGTTNTCKEVKKIFQIPQINSDNYGEIIASFVTSDFSKICIINSIPYTKNENLKLECRVYETKNFSLIESYPIELPFVFKGKAKDLSFREKKFDNVFTLSLLTTDNSDNVGMLLFYFKETDNFKPHSTFFSLEKYRDVSYSILPVFSEKDNLCIKLNYNKLNRNLSKSNEPENGLLYFTINLKNDKISDLTEVPYEERFMGDMLGMKLVLTGVISTAEFSTFCISSNKLLLARIKYQQLGPITYEVKTIVFYMIEGKSIRKIYEMDLDGPKLHDFPIVNLIPSDKPSIIVALLADYNDAKKVAKKNNWSLPNDSKIKSGTNLLLYHVFDPETQKPINTGYITSMNPKKQDTPLDILCYFPVINNNYIISQFILFFKNDFIGLANFQ
ncbi:MAG: hypothetical protein OHK0036_02920 [Bacteroidia bacterium]